MTCKRKIQKALKIPSPTALQTRLKSNHSTKAKEDRQTRLKADKIPKQTRRKVLDKTQS